MTRSLRWLVGIVCIIVLGTALPASACSCAEGDARTQLKASDAAFIGTLLSQSPSGQWNAVYTFRVDEEVKGDLGETVAVESANNGAACGLEVGVGRQTGLFLDGSADEGWSSSLCQQISPDALREAAQPMPEPDGEGPIRMLVGGKWGDMGIVALDSEGRTLSYGRRPGGSTVMAVCPGSTRFLETLWRKERRIVVRDTATMEIVKALDIADGRGASRVWCLDEGGEHLIVAGVRYSEPLSKTAVYEIEGGTTEVVYDGTASWPELVGEELYLTEGRYGRKVQVLDLVSGEKTFIARVPRYVQGVSVSPDGTKLATTSGADNEKLIVIDRATSPATVIVKEHGLGMDGEMYWLDDDTIVYLPGGYDNARAKIFDASLESESRLDGYWYTLDEVISGSTAYGMGWGTLFRAELPGGPAEVLREFPSPMMYSLELVTGDIHAQNP